MEWKTFIVERVFASNQAQNCWVYLKTTAGDVGWRKIQPNSADGVSNILQIATSASLEGHVAADNAGSGGWQVLVFVDVLMSDADEIVAISY